MKTFKRKINHPCNYCGRPAKYRFKTGKKSYCCESNVAKCPAIKKINSEKAKQRTGWNHSEETKNKIRAYRHTDKAKEIIRQFHLGKPKSEEHKANLSIAKKGCAPTCTSFKKGHLPTASAWKPGTIPWNKGKPRSEEVKKKISDTRNERLASGLIVIAEETKQKIADANRGQTRSEETRLKMSLAASGERSSQWQGGIACEPYCGAWLDKEYKESILKRDDYRCQNPNCRKNSDKLCRHHINYDKRDCHHKNIITVCFSCNSRANAKRQQWQTFYQNIMIEKYGYNYSYREIS